MNTTYNENILYIPDYVLPGDESAIIKFFHNFEIAKVEKVEIYKHKEPEYNTYNNNTYQFYSYAIIYILEWYDTNNAENFYNNIFENKAKIVYNDPDYWDVEFCDPRLYCTPDNSDLPQCIYENTNVLDNCIEFLSDKCHQYNCNDYNCNVQYTPSSDFVNVKEDDVKEEEDEEEEDVKEEEDDVKEEEDEEEEEEEDEEEVVQPIAYRKFYNTRSKTMRNMKNKVKKEEKTIEIIKTKNEYVKKNKRKSTKTCWDGRLRKRAKC